MSQSPVFEWVATRLQAATKWSALEARGTVRLALKDMGIDPRFVSKREMLAVVRTTLSRALESRRFNGAKQLCDFFEMELAYAAFDSEVESPEAVFQRFGRP
jgi:hypothetical protein